MTDVVDADRQELLDELSKPFLAAWRDFKIASGAVRKCLIDDERCGYQGKMLNGEGEPVPPHQEAARLYTDFEREEGDDPKRSNVGFGVIVISTKAFCAIEKLNEAKTAVIEALDELKHQNHVTLEEIKAHVGLSRLHYYKVLRPVKGLPGQRPESIGLSVEQKIDIERRTVEECRELLKDFGELQPHIQVQLDALRRLEPGEMLAYVFESNNLRVTANVSFPKNPNTGIRERGKLRSVMPFYVVSQTPDWAPAIKLPRYVKLTDRIERQERSDRRIEPDPFLPSIHVHRYSPKQA